MKESSNVKREDSVAIVESWIVMMEDEFVTIDDSIVLSTAAATRWRH